MSKPKLSTYAETQFGAYMGEDYLKRFNDLSDKVSFEMTMYSASLYLNGFIGENCKSKIKAYLHINGYEPYFIFALCSNRFKELYVSHNPLSSDLLMLKCINQKMNKRELTKLHSWVVNMAFGQLSDMSDKLKVERKRLLAIYENKILTVAYNQPVALSIANQTQKQQNYLSIVR